MNKCKGFTLQELLFVVVAVAGFIGWIWNIVKIVAMASDPITGMFILRCVGIFVAPIGCVLGYIP